MSACQSFSKHVQGSSTQAHKEENHQAEHCWHRVITGGALGAACMLVRLQAHASVTCEAGQGCSCHTCRAASGKFLCPRIWYRNLDYLLLPCTARVGVSRSVSYHAQACFVLLL